MSPSADQDQRRRAGARRRLRVTLGVALAVPCLTAPFAAAAPITRAARSGAGSPGTQRLAVLTQAANAFAQPSSGSSLLAVVARLRPITGERTVLPVVASATDSQGQAWLDVLLPGRPNGRAGWIAAQETRPAVARWAIRVHLSSRELQVSFDGRAFRSFKVVVGKPSTPTPVGRFFVEESVKLSSQDSGAPYALALSGRSNVLQDFAGGPGQIALHGTSNLVGVPGTAASHGCVRLDTRDITWLAERIGPGTRVTISR
jgi:lipoprotein-anchoring transpeptidase ErfK/SrfK